MFIAIDAMKKSVVVGLLFEVLSWWSTLLIYSKCKYWVCILSHVCVCLWKLPLVRWRIYWNHLILKDVYSLWCYEGICGGWFIVWGVEVVVSIIKGSFLVCLLCLNKLHIITTSIIWNFELYWSTNKSLSWFNPLTETDGVSPLDLFKEC